MSSAFVGWEAMRDQFLVSYGKWESELNTTCQTGDQELVPTPAAAQVPPPPPSWLRPLANFSQLSATPPLAQSGHPLLASSVVAKGIAAGWLECRDGEHFCVACGKWATEGHLSTGKHNFKVLDWAVAPSSVVLVGKNAGWLEDRDGENFCLACRKWATKEHLETDKHKAKVKDHALMVASIDETTSVDPSSLPSSNESVDAGPSAWSALRLSTNSQFPTVTSSAATRWLEDGLAASTAPKSSGDDSLSLDPSAPLSSATSTTASLQMHQALQIPQPQKAEATLGTANDDSLSICSLTTADTIPKQWACVWCRKMAASDDADWCNWQGLYHWTCTTCWGEWRGVTCRNDSHK